MIDRVLVLSLGGCALFGVLLLHELTSADGNPPAAVTAPARAEGAAAARVRGTRIDELLAIALGHPLFSATRKPAEAKADRSVEQQMPNLRLTGIVIEPGRHLAIFAVAGAKPLVRSEGETVNEWQLDNISRQQVSLSGPAGTTTMEPKTDPNIVRPAPAAQPAATPGRPVMAGPQRTSSFTPPASPGSMPPRPSR